MAEGYCEIHKVQMKEIDGKFGKFYSHETDDERYEKRGKKNLRYCNGELPKELKDDNLKTGTTHQGKYDTSQIRCKIWEIAWRVFSSDPEARKQCIEEAERYIFTGDLVDNEKPFEHEG